MNSTEWFFFSAVVLAWARMRSQARAEADKWREEVPINGTDFQGAIWDRLAGTDLLTARWEGRNLDSSLIADPGKVGQASIGLAPAWNGNL